MRNGNLMSALMRLFVLAMVGGILALASETTVAESKGTGPNLVPNPGFKLARKSDQVPAGWHRRSSLIPGIKQSQVFLTQIPGYPGTMLAISGGDDRAGQVWCDISNISPQTAYLLEVDVYRPQFINGVYPEVEIFGQRLLLNQNCVYGGVQHIFLHLNSGRCGGRTRLALINRHEQLFAFGSPSLVPVRKQAGLEKKSDRAVFLSFFPVGIFGASLESLREIREAGFNAVQTYDGRPENIRPMISAAEKYGLKLLANFRTYNARLSQELGGRPGLLGFYIEDEPELRSIPPRKIMTVHDLIKADHPRALTAVAMVRPRMVAEYQGAADIFMLDQYPVPNMPMTWLSDSLAEAANFIDASRIWAVVQAFGGPKYSKYGWPRLPTREEMRCLTYLAIIHGARGIFYFSYPEISASPTGWAGLKSIVAELRQLRSWLVVPHVEPTLRIEMTSPFKADAEGRPAVHFCQKKLGQQNLVLVVNAIDQPVSFTLTGFVPEVHWVENFFTLEKTVIQDGNLRDDLGPYEARFYRTAP